MKSLFWWLSLGVIVTGCSSSPVAQEEPEERTCGYANYQRSEEAQGVAPVDEDPCATLRTQRIAEKDLPNLLKKYLKNTAVLLEKPEDFRLQVLISEMVDIEGSACVIEHEFRVDAEYFYPASAIKTVASVAALRAAEERGVSLTDSIVFGVDGPRIGTNLYTLLELVNETQIVSNNDTFNRLYEFAGHDRMNQMFWDVGFSSLRMQHRMFSKRTPEQERIVPEVQFCPGMKGDASGCRFKMLFLPRVSALPLPAIEGSGLRIGTSYSDLITGELVEEPMDFSTKNTLSLRDHQRLMRALLLENSGIDFGMNEDSRTLIVDAMKHDPVAYKPELGEGSRQRFKPMLPGLEAAGAQNVVYFNKAGRALGFHVENAALVVPEKSHPIFVTATVYVNADGRLNDDQYEYQTLSFPFFSELGALVASEFIH